MTQPDLIKIVIFDYWFVSIPCIVIVSIGITLIVAFKMGWLKPKQCQDCPLPDKNKELEKKAGDTYQMFLNMIGNFETSVDLARHNGELAEIAIEKAEKLEKKVDILYERLLEKDDKQIEALIKIGTTLDILIQKSKF